MKKWIIYMLLVLFAATTASAQWWKLGLGGEETDQPPPQQVRRGHPDGQRSKMSEEQRTKMKEKRGEMKAHREAVQKLTEAARNETDPEKKAARVDELRAKVTEGAEKMHAEFRNRLARAEGDVTKMKERLADAEENKEQRIEQHVQDLLAGKKPERPEGKGADGGHRRKGLKPAE